MKKSRQEIMVFVLFIVSMFRGRHFILDPSTWRTENQPPEASRLLGLTLSWRLYSCPFPDHAHFLPVSLFSISASSGVASPCDSGETFGGSNRSRGKKPMRPAKKEMRNPSMHIL